MPYHSAFKLYGAEGSGDELRSRCAGFLSDLARWRKEADLMPLDSFIWKLMQETGIMNYAAALSSGRQRQRTQ